MFKKVLKGFGYFFLFLFALGIVGAVVGGKGTSTDATTKKLASTVKIEEEIPEELHQKQVFTMSEKYFKGKIYPPNDTVKWVFVRFLIRGDILC